MQNGTSSSADVQPFRSESGKRRIWGIITGEFGYARGNWAPSGGLRWQVGTTQATGWVGVSQEKVSPSVMEGMRHEGLRPVWLLLDTGIPSRGWNSWSQPQTSNHTWDLVPGAQATRVGLAPGGVLVPAVGWRVGCQQCSSSTVRLLPQVEAQSQLQVHALGRRGCQEDHLVYPLAERALGLAHQAHRQPRQLAGVRWWVPRPIILCFQARKPVHLLFQPFQWWTDMSNDSHTLVQLPCCFAGTTLGIPCSIWGVFNTRESAYQLHMYQTGPLTTKNL